MERPKCRPALENMLLELLEIVLVKGAVIVFERQRKFSSDADSLAIATVLMVCQHWRHVLKCRPFIKQQLKRTLDHVSRPLRRRIDSSSCRSLFAREEDVDGIATLDNQLFVISNESSTVCVFDLTSFTQLQTIELGGLLKDPWDIATCDATRRIYIADYGNKCVCRIDWSPLSRSTATVSNDSPSPSATKFIVCEGYRPWRLSTSGRRQQLLVTGYDGNSLHVYDVDGKLLRHVRLSTEVDDDGVKWFDVRHAVQATTGDDYFVCRLGNDQHQQWEWTHAEVAEYNSTGQRLRCYYSGPRGGGPLQLDKPAYMSLINDGCLLVVADSEARRVVLLNTELKLERVLLTRQQLNNENDDDDCRPSLLSLCYNSQTGLLCVGGCSGSINVYQIS